MSRTVSGLTGHHHTINNAAAYLGFAMAWFRASQIDLLKLQFNLNAIHESGFVQGESSPDSYRDRIKFSAKTSRHRPQNVSL